MIELLVGLVPMSVVFGVWTWRAVMVYRADPAAGWGGAYVWALAEGLVLACLAVLAAAVLCIAYALGAWILQQVGGEA
jgi:hypothetical protein